MRDNVGIGRRTAKFYGFKPQIVHATKLLGQGLGKTKHKISTLQTSCLPPYQTGYHLSLSVGSAFLDSNINPFETRILGGKIQIVPSETYKAFTTGYRPIRDQFFRGLSESTTPSTHKLLVNYMIDKGLILESHRAKLEAPIQRLLEIEKGKLSFQDYKLRLKEKPGYSELLGYYSGINELAEFERVLNVLHTFYVYSENISDGVKAGSRKARIENIRYERVLISKLWIFDFKIEDRIVDDSLRFYVDPKAPSFVSELYLNELIQLGILPPGTTTNDLQSR
jgi:hypothetical protein